MCSAFCRSYCADGYCADTLQRRCSQHSVDNTALMHCDWNCADLLWIILCWLILDWCIVNVIVLGILQMIMRWCIVIDIVLMHCEWYCADMLWWHCADVSWWYCARDMHHTLDFNFSLELIRNKLASLEATLVRNYDSLTDSLTA